MIQRAWKHPPMPPEPSSLQRSSRRYIPFILCNKSRFGIANASVIESNGTGAKWSVVGVASSPTTWPVASEKGELAAFWLYWSERNPKGPLMSFGFSVSVTGIGCIGPASLGVLLASVVPSIPVDDLVFSICRLAFPAGWLVLSCGAVWRPPGPEWGACISVSGSKIAVDFGSLSGSCKLFQYSLYSHIAKRPYHCAEAWTPVRVKKIYRTHKSSDAHRYPLGDVLGKLLWVQLRREDKSRSTRDCQAPLLWITYGHQALFPWSPISKALAQSWVDPLIACGAEFHFSSCPLFIKRFKYRNIISRRFDGLINSKVLVIDCRITLAPFQLRAKLQRAYSLVWHKDWPPKAECDQFPFILFICWIYYTDQGLPSSQLRRQNTIDANQNRWKAWKWKINALPH